jgi:hypothetical protein
VRAQRLADAVLEFGGPSTSSRQSPDGTYTDQKEKAHMKRTNQTKSLRRSLSLFAAISIGSAGVFVAAPSAFAEDPAIVQGPNVVADPGSPTGYTVTFVYHNPNATQVRLAGDLTLLDLATGNTRYQPEQWQLGRYHAGGTEFLRDMTKDADGNWSVSVPLHAGGLSYWYRVWDPTQGWANKRIWDPTSTNPRPPGDASFRVRNNDVLDAVYVPYAEKQNDPVLEGRAAYELPVTEPSQRGTVQYVPYTTILGNSGHYLGVYLPAGYDADRAEPYKVVYLAHGIFGDETDFMVPGNIPNILDNMIARGEIEPTVAVTMGNHFTGTSLGFASYNRANAANNLVQTILPLMEQNFNVSADSDGRAFGGFSFGGSTGGIVIASYPTTFGYYGYFSGNPSLTTAQYDQIAGSVGTNDLFVFLGNGVFEGQPQLAEQHREPVPVARDSGRDGASPWCPRHDDRRPAVHDLRPGVSVGRGQGRRGRLVRRLPRHGLAGRTQHRAEAESLPRHCGRIRRQ